MDTKKPPVSNYKPTDEIFILNRMQLEQKRVPSTLYKYWSVKSALRFLETGQIMFNRYSEFNDPFECQANIDTNNTEAEWRQFLINNGVQPHIAKQRANDLMKNKMLASSHIRKSIQAVYDETGIFCMTTKNDNLLMWAHYADMHKGVCIEFDVTKDPLVFCPIRKVTYSHDYRTYNYINNHKEAFISLAYKSDEWDYEDEYRILHEGGYGLMSINKEAVKTIIFGCRTEKAEMDKIKKALKANGYTKAKYKVAKMSKSAYSLIIP